MFFKERYNYSFDAICCLNGDLPQRQNIDKFIAKKIIAADGAAIQLIEMGVLPDIIIGDFDSINKSIIPDEFDTNNIIHDPDQNSSDFDKILNHCSRNNFHSVLVLGIHGGELDHTLNNLSIFKKFADRLELTLFDENKFGFFTGESFSFATKPGEMISLLPFPIAKITTENLKWNLDNEILEMGVREGARNRATSNHAFIQIHAGSLFCFADAFED
jgi:thiamine pyrophosphokinase